MRCVHCGMVNPESVIFCQNCGVRLVGTQRAIGSSSFSSHTPPAGSLLPLRSSRLDTSLPGVSHRAHRTRGRGLWRLSWLVLALLVAGAGLALLIANSPQPAASASQTLLTYCDALQRGEYHQAYEQWTSSVRQQMSEADFAYFYQSRRKVTTCTVSNVSVDNSSAMGTVSLTFADGSAVTAVVLLVMVQGTWKIQGQNSLSEPSGLQATRLCPSNATPSFHAVNLTLTSASIALSISPKRPDLPVAQPSIKYTSAGEVNYGQRKSYKDALVKTTPKGIVHIELYLSSSACFGLSE